MNKFWDMAVVKDAVADTDIGQITMYGDISDTSWWGDEITPAQFKADLDNLGDVKNIDIYINSGGGDVFAGYAIYNMLKRHSAKKTVYIDGLAASIASLIAMAGDEIVMPSNSMMMIHNAWAIVAGNKTDLRDMADQLDKVDGLLVDTYVKKTGLEQDEVVAMLDNETWLTASEAVEKGFATRLEEPTAVAASIDPKFYDRYHNVPETLNNRGESEPVEEDIPQPVEEVEQAEIADAPDKIEEQRKDFNRIRRKIYERKN